MRLAEKALLLFLLPAQFCSGAIEYPSRSTEIDQYREAVKAMPTTPDNYLQRAKFLNLWSNIAQQRRADTHALFDSDKLYFATESKLLQAKGEAREAALQDICKTVNDDCQTMESNFRTLNEEDTISSPFKGDLAGFPEGCDMEAEWPMFQNNKNNTGYTDAPGTKTGELAWRFRLGWGAH